MRIPCRSLIIIHLTLYSEPRAKKKNKKNALVCYSIQYWCVMQQVTRIFQRSTRLLKKPFRLSVMIGIINLENY